jgi:hypothetical protein
MLRHGWFGVFALVGACASSVSPIAPTDAGRDAPALDVFDAPEPDTSREDRLDVPPPLDAPALDRSTPDDRSTADILAPTDAPRCPNGTALCDGRCVGLDTNLHCGRCGNACVLGACCLRGECVSLMCKPGLSDCDGVCANGCEVDFRNDVNHCGACGRPCALAHATAGCDAGRCVVARCDPNYGDCDANPANGCETELTENASHCGRCNEACAPASGVAGVCVSGRCAVVGCAARPGFGDCDMNAANGCETGVLNDVCNCGACGRQCMLLGVSAPRCEAGRCVGGACLEGFADCDGRASNGCETPTARNRANCGGCGRVCRATEICTGGACRCPLDQTSCAGACVNVQYDLAHCGACGNACPAGLVCSRGACASSCAEGETRCGDRCSDLNDSQNCGACGNACPAGLSCAFGRCGLLGCGVGRTACGGVCVDTQTDTQNCGACGNACPAGSVCQAGACMNLLCRRM